eukprot:8150656-Alexandrium_andersonii.AAC.1
MSASLVGSEMCIRDRASWGRPCGPCHAHKPTANITEDGMADVTGLLRGCLLYTSDAADDM